MNENKYSRYVLGKAKVNKESLGVTSGMKYTGIGLAVERRIRYMRQNIETSLQHGPVRVFFKDGKPVNR